MKKSSSFSLFVSCAKGLEPVLLQELEELGMTACKKAFGGIQIPYATMQDVYRINYYSRFATRVLMNINTFNCRNAEELYQNIFKFDWLSYIPKRKTFAVDAHAQKTDNFRNTLFVAQVVKDAICDQFRNRFGTRPDVETYQPDVQIHISIARGLASLSIDTSGDPLYKRGYRKKNVEAPLQESLAAAFLQISGYHREGILCDPCCGSGTFLIEAMWMASNTPPGCLRQKWGFLLLPEHQPQLWENVKNEADSKKIPLQTDRFFGIELSYHALEACKANIAAAQIGLEYVTLTRGDFYRHKPAQPYTYVVTNPPYGVRLKEQQSLQGFYRQLGTFIKNNTLKPAKAVIFTGNLDLIPYVGMQMAEQHPFYNGGLESRLLQYDLS